MKLARVRMKNGVSGVEKDIRVIQALEVGHDE